MEPSSGFDRDAIRRQLDRILASPEFHATDKMRAFLRFVVDEKLAGRTHRLKGYTVAVEVFGRAKDFDATNDPIVRIQAGRLRRALERYYLVAGDRDPILID
ncbi:MAG: adenylate cyclase, partial [Gemmatimonadota bacterium]